MEEKTLLQKMFSPARLYPLVLLLGCYIVYKYRQGKAEKESNPVVENVAFLHQNGMNIVKGETMGHIPYTVKYVSDSINYKEEIDSVLKQFNAVFSTYIPSSQISLVNHNDTVCGVSEDFKLVLEQSKVIASKTNQYFDPTVMPLVNAWGFGYNRVERLPTTTEIDSILNFTGVDKVRLDSNCVVKSNAKVQLDFSAIAKGYASDVVTSYLVSKGIESMMVEIGGEVVCKGKKLGKEWWMIGVEKPTKESQSVVLAVSVQNEAIATSGNYRNYISSEGKDYGHTINPHTGKVADTDMLSATVKAKTCLEADAYATAFMAMGATKSILLAKELNDLEVFFIYKEGQVVKQYQSEGFER